MPYHFTNITPIDITNTKCHFLKPYARTDLTHTKKSRRIQKPGLRESVVKPITAEITIIKGDHDGRD